MQVVILSRDASVSEAIMEDKSNNARQSIRFCTGLGNWLLISYNSEEQFWDMPLHRILTTVKLVYVWMQIHQSE